MASKSSFVPRIVIIEGQEKGKVIPLIHGTAIIGRSKGDILVQDPRVSRSHVALQFDEKREVLSFTDLKSLNGTFVNGEESKSGELKDGDRLQLGDTTFDCQMTPAYDTNHSIRIKRQEEREEQISKQSKVEQPKAPSERRERKERKEPEMEVDLTPLDVVEPEQRVPTKAKAGRKRPRRGLKQLYLKIPARTRRIGLSLIIIVLGLSYLAKEQGSLGGLEGKLNSIRSLNESGHVDEAIAEAQNLTAQNPTSSEGHMLLGDLFAGQQNNEQAIASYLKVHSIQPVNPIVHVKLIRMYLRSGLTARANEEYVHLGAEIRETGRILSKVLGEEKLTPTQIVERNPYIRDLFIETAELFLEFRNLKEPPDQLLLIARALQRDIAPQAVVGYKLEAQVLLQQKRTEEAIKVLEYALRMDSRDRWVIENVALAKFRVRDYVGAEQVVQTWLHSYPEATRAHLIMAYLKFTQNDPKGALPYLSTIVDLGSKNSGDPYYPEALYLIGQVHLQQNEIKQATEYVSEACSLGYQASCNSPLLKGRKPTSP